MPINIGGAAQLSASFGTELSLTGAALWAKVDANGVLMRPQTPHMEGNLAGKGAPYNNSGNPLLITANRNTGNCYNGANGLFTCPFDGYYMVTGAGIMSGTSGYFYIYKNGAGVHFTHWSHSGSWHYVPVSGILKCVTGDYIDFRIASPSPATAGIYGEGGHQMFSIALMV